MKKKENKTCFILYTISSSMFLLAALMQFLNENIVLAICNLGSSVCFGSLSYIYYKKYKGEK